MGTRFEVGKMYKTREGKELMFAAHAPLAKPDQRAVFVTKQGDVVLRCEDGRYYEGRNNVEDVVQPPLVLTQYSVVWYKRNDPGCLYHSPYYKTAEKAEEYAKQLSETDNRRVLLPIQVITYEVQE